MKTGADAKWNHLPTSSRTCTSTPHISAVHGSQSLLNHVEICSDQENPNANVQCQKILLWKALSIMLVRSCLWTSLQKPTAAHFWLCTGTAATIMHHPDTPKDEGGRSPRVSGSQAAAQHNRDDSEAGALYHCRRSRQRCRAPASASPLRCSAAA